MGGLIDSFSKYGKLRSKVMLGIQFVFFIVCLALLITFTVLYKKEPVYEPIQAKILSAICSPKTETYFGKTITSYNCDLELEFMYKGSMIKTSYKGYNHMNDLSTKIGSNIIINYNKEDPYDLTQKSFNKGMIYKIIMWIFILLSGVNFFFLIMAFLQNYLNKKSKASSTYTGVYGLSDYLKKLF
jgi:hypothetical protein